MNKYTIEGGINFYESLYKSLDIEDLNDEDINLCLITNQPLSAKFIKLDCDHKFNYIPLFLDIKNHKQKFNGMEGSSGKLNVDEIRCPYCRKKQKGLLPYYEEFGIDKTHGVNYVNPFANNNTSHANYKKCEYIKLNPKYDENGDEPVETQKYNIGNCKFHICSTIGSQINYGTNENYGDEKNYCWSHKKEMIKKYKQEIKNKAKECEKKAKEVIKKEKEEEKQKLKEEKQKLKQKEKEEKQKLKEKKEKVEKKEKEENVVLGPSIITDSCGNIINNMCIQILKSGPKKGEKCGCKIVSENICKRHFLLKNTKECN